VGEVAERTQSGPRIVTETETRKGEKSRGKGKTFSHYPLGKRGDTVHLWNCPGDFKSSIPKTLGPKDSVS